MRSGRISSEARTVDTLASTSTTEASTRIRCCIALSLVFTNQTEVARAVTLSRSKPVASTYAGSTALGTLEHARLVAQGRCDEALPTRTKLPLTGGIPRQRYRAQHG